MNNKQNEESASYLSQVAQLIEVAGLKLKIVKYPNGKTILSYKQDAIFLLSEEYSSGEKKWQAPLEEVVEFLVEESEQIKNRCNFIPRLLSLLKRGKEVDKARDKFRFFAEYITWGGYDGEDARFYPIGPGLLSAYEIKFAGEVFRFREEDFVAMEKIMSAAEEEERIMALKRARYKERVDELAEKVRSAGIILDWNSEKEQYPFGIYTKNGVSIQFNRKDFFWSGEGVSALESEVMRIIKLSDEKKSRYKKMADDGAEFFSDSSRLPPTDRHPYGEIFFRHFLGKEEIKGVAAFDFVEKAVAEATKKRREKEARENLSFTIQVKDFQSRNHLAPVATGKGTFEQAVQSVLEEIDPQAYSRRGFILIITINAPPIFMEDKQILFHNFGERGEAKVVINAIKRLRQEDLIAESGELIKKKIIFPSP